MQNIDYIKALRLYGQHLTNKTDKRTVVRDLNGLQSQFMSNAFHGLRIRCNEVVTEADFGGGLVKNWTLRGTVHVFAKEDLLLFIRENYRLLDFTLPTWWNSRPCWNLTPEGQKYFSEVILEALKDSPKSREALKEICRKNGMTEAEEGSMFDPWGGGIRELCQRGFMNYTVREEKEFELTPEYVPMSNSEAETELLRRYFTNFSPASVKDAAYYFGVSQTKIKALMKTLPVESFSADGVEFYHIGALPSDVPEIPKCILLSGFDQLMLGYKKEENPFLPKEHLRGIFNLSGIVMPAILLNGRVVGKWKYKNGKIIFELFETVSESDKKTVSETASQLFEIKKESFLSL